MSDHNQILKVLLIEDNPGDAFLVKFYLEESSGMDYELTHCESLTDGINHLKENEVHITLLDMHLPDSDGMDTVKTLLENCPKALVIVMTGLTAEEVGLETVKLGAQDFLVKGKFDGKVLNSSLRYAFERFQLNAKLQSYSEELKYSNGRFEAMQEFFQVGYFDYFPSDKTFFLSNNMYTVLGVDNIGSNAKEEDFYAHIGTDLSDAINKITSSEKSTVISVNQTIKGKEVTITARYTDCSKTDNKEKVCGIFKLA